jgi:hypothetical protein
MIRNTQTQDAQEQDARARDSWQTAFLEDDSGQLVFGAILLELFLLVMGAPQSIPNEPFATIGTTLARTAALMYCGAVLHEAKPRNALIVLGIYAMLTWAPQAWAFTLEARTDWISGIISSFSPLLLGLGVHGFSRLVPVVWWLLPILIMASLFAPGQLGPVRFALIPQLLGETFPIWPALALLLTVAAWIFDHTQGHRNEAQA